MSRHGRRLPRLPLIKDGFMTRPGHRDLAGMTEQQLSRVEGFAVQMDGVGELKCLAPVNLRGEDLAAMLVFEPRNILVRRVQDPEPGNSGGQRLPDVPAVVSLALFAGMGVLPPSDQLDLIEAALQKDDGAATGQPKRFRDFQRDQGVY